MATLARRKIRSPNNTAAFAPQPSVGGWTPASLGSALRLWIKADIGVTQTGGIIDSVADQSGNGFTMSAATTHKPTLNATGYNSLPAIIFSAASDTWLKSVQDAALSMGGASSWFFVGRMLTGTSNYGRAFSYLGATDRPSSYADFNGPGSIVAMERNGTTNAINSFQAGAGYANGSVPLNTNMRVSMIFNGTNATLRVNTTSTYSDTAVGGPTAATFTLNSSGTLIIGNGVEGVGSVAVPQGGAWDGPIAEALVTNTALSSGDRASLDAYIIARLGV